MSHSSSPDEPRDDAPRAEEPSHDEHGHDRSGRQPADRNSRPIDWLAHGLRVLLLGLAVASVAILWRQGRAAQDAVDSFRSRAGFVGRLSHDGRGQLVVTTGDLTVTVEQVEQIPQPASSEIGLLLVEPGVTVTETAAAQKRLAMRMPTVRSWYVTTSP